MEKLEKVVDDFCQAMKERLRQKGENEHFTGWNNEQQITNLDLVYKLFDRAVILFKDPAYISKQLLIDIANFSLFLWFRSKE